MIPAWVRRGAQCVCVEDDWKFCGERLAGRWPAANRRYTISDFVVVDTTCYLILSDDGIDPAYFDAACFRPLTPLEADVALFAVALKDASECMEAA